MSKQQLDDAKYERVEMTYESSRVILKIDETANLAWVTGLFSHKKRQGHARKLMEDVIQTAREKNMILLLKAEPHGPPDNPNTGALVQFYKSLGFKLLKAHLPEEHRMIWQVRSTDEDD